MWSSMKSGFDQGIMGKFVRHSCDLFQIATMCPGFLRSQFYNLRLQKLTWLPEFANKHVACCPQANTDHF